jgi:hypothetical protein
VPIAYPMLALLVSVLGALALRRLLARSRR